MLAGIQKLFAKPFDRLERTITDPSCGVFTIPFWMYVQSTCVVGSARWEPALAAASAAENDMNAAGDVMVVAVVVVDVVVVVVPVEADGEGARVCS